jgi:hypothetical protein
VKRVGFTVLGVAFLVLGVLRFLYGSGVLK